MKKIVICLILFLCILVANVSAISFQEAKKYVGHKILVVQDQTVIPYGTMGEVIDVFKTQDNSTEYLILKTLSYQYPLRFIEIENIAYIKDYGIQRGRR